MTEVCDV